MSVTPNLLLEDIFSGGEAMVGGDGRSDTTFEVVRSVEEVAEDEQAAADLESASPDGKVESGSLHDDSEL